MIEALEKASGSSVSRETVGRLERYAELLTAENSRQNLVGKSTLEELWNRHIIDSAQLARFGSGEANWVDIGSGAGLPGIVLACLIQGAITLVEPRRLRAEFLHQVVGELGLKATVVTRRAESVDGTYDVITGRAVASLSRFLGMCAHLSTRNTTWVLPKGRTAESELEDALISWQGMFHVEQSVTNPDAKIIVGTGVRAKSR